MERETLAQYRDLKREIEHLEQRIQRLKTTVIDSVRASNAEFPYQEIHVTIEGEVSPKKELENILALRSRQCQAMALSIERFIADIDDSRIRQIFELRYIEGWTWEKISECLGATNESYARKLHNKFLEEREGEDEIR